MGSVLDRGLFILSLDTELAWGSAHSGKYAERRGLFENTRPCISRLLQLLEKYRIHATWAIVGHLFLERCQPVNGVKHPEIVRPAYAWYPGDWLEPDPCGSVETEPGWYGADIIKQIAACRVSQEIGCHTFSHVRVGQAGCGPECFTSELEACRLLAGKSGLTLKSFVFPRNEEGHWDILARQGYTAFRGQLPSSLISLRRIIPGPLYMSMATPTVLPEKKMGLWNLPGCMFYPPPKGLTWPPAITFQVIRAKRALRSAVSSRRLFHLWFHPFNLASAPDRLLGGLEKIFDEVDRLREAGRLDNLTMAETADRLNRQAEKPAAIREASTAAGPSR